MSSMRSKPRRKRSPALPNLRVYVDNSVIGRLLDIERGLKRGSQKLEEDMAILPNLFQLCAEKGIRLCASADAGTEIEKLRPSMPQLTEALLTKLRSLPLLPIRHTLESENSHDDKGAAESKASPNPVDLLAQELKAFLLSKTRVTNEAKRKAVAWDAYHLAVCQDNGCQIFLTCDYASIWAYRRFLKRLFAIEVRRPSELFAEIRQAPPGS